MDTKQKPIRVLHIVTHLTRNGLESRIMDIYRNIDRDKVQFDFLIHRNEKGDLGDEIEKLGGKIYYFPRISPSSFPTYLKKLDSFFDEHPEYKIVHSHLNSLSTWVLWKAKQHGVPVRIAHSRNASMEKDIKAIPKYISKLFINRMATDYFGCSVMAGEWLFGKNVAHSSSFRVIQNAFQVDNFIWDEQIRERKREEIGIEKDEVAVIDVARLSEQKNHIFLIDVFEKLREREPLSHLYLAGSGECEEKIVKYIKSKHLEEYITLLGSRSDVNELYQAADLFIFPSKYEGFGTVVIEAQVTGLPVLASDTIPRETKLCDCVKFESLNSSAETWAADAEEMLKNSKRCDNSEVLRSSGFDIKKQYKWMEEFYIKKYEEFNNGH